MGIRGLLTYCSQNLAQVSHVVDLIELARARTSIGSNLEILVDFYAFNYFLAEQVIKFLSDLDDYLPILAGEYNAIDYCFKNFIFSLASAGISLVFFEDGPSGSDVNVLEEKFEELQRRAHDNEESNERVAQVCKSYLSMEQLGCDQIPHLISRQIGSTVIRMKEAFGTKHVKCRGEAEVDMVKYLRENPEKAYAILGNDSDFVVLKESRFIPYDFFDVSKSLVPNLMGPFVNLEKLFVRVITPQAVWRSLKLSCHQDLIEVAMACGNDFTKHHWEKIDYKNLCPVRGIKEVSGWFRQEIGPGNLLECNPKFYALFERNPKIKEAVSFSRQFYLLTLEEAVDDEKTSELFSMIKRRVIAHSLPTHALSWAQGLHRRRIITESHSLGEPVIIDDLHLFRQYLYALALGPTSTRTAIREFGRTREKPFDIVDIEIVKIPIVTSDYSLVNYEIRLTMFDNLLTSLDDDGDKLKRLGFDESKYISASGSASGEAASRTGLCSRDFFFPAFSSVGAKNVHEAFLAYLVSYLLSLSLSPKAKATVTPMELLAIVNSLLTVLRESENPEYDPYLIMRQNPQRVGRQTPPDMRCLTLGSWCEMIYGLAMDASICLDIQAICPTPALLFSGMLFDRSYRRFVKGGKAALKGLDPTVIKFVNGIVSQHPDPRAADYLIEAVDSNLFPVMNGYESLVSDNGASSKSTTSDLPINMAGLPILDHRDRLMTAIHEQRVTCIEGETGCGKSTQVPQFILDDWKRNPLLYSRKPKIIVTQPRRIAAKTLAERVASERRVELGGEVGYRIGQDYRTSSSTRILFVTTGYMMRALTHHSEEMLRSCTHLLLDEVHERELENDLLSLIVKLVLKKFPDLKLVVMSATIQGDLFLKYFATGSEIRLMDEAVLFVGARRFPVDDFFLEDLPAIFPDAFDDDDCLALFKNACIFNKKPSAFYLEMDSSQSQVAALGEGFGALSDLAKRLHTRNRNAFSGASAYRQPGVSVDGDEMRLIFVRILPFLVSPGESILVFLPGRAAIDDMFDLVVNFEGSVPPPGWYCPIRVFVLHSMVPFEDQLDAFKTPAHDVCHLILATNVAESSITLPKVRIVVDFGQQRRPVYHPDRRMTMLDLHFCSQASCKQRRGRTGRVFPGTCIKFFTREFYEQMAPFDPPQMQDSPLDNLVLQVKSLGRLIAPGDTPTELLLQSVEPPRTENIREAVRTLADIGAIENNDEMAELTLLGHIGMCLPIDLRYARLIVYGILFGVECDGVVFAAAIQSKDPFNQPTKKILKDDTKFIVSVENSTRARNDFDDGLYSEPIMLRNLFVNWLLLLEEHERKKHKGIVGNHMTLADLKKRFCNNNAVMEKRFNAFENLIADLANYAVNMAYAGASRTRLLKLVSLLPRNKRKKNVAGGVASPKTPGQDQEDRELAKISVADIFVPINGGFGRRGLGQKRFTSGDPTQDLVNVYKLYSLLTAALSPMFLVGEVQPLDDNKGQKKGPKNKMAELDKHFTAAGFDSSRSIALTDILDLTSAASAAQHLEKSAPQQEAKKGKKPKKAEHESKTFKKQDLVKSLLDRLTRGVEKAAVSSTNADTVFVQFHDSTAKSTSTEAAESPKTLGGMGSASPAAKASPSPQAASSSTSASTRIPVLRDVPFNVHDVFKFSEGKTRFVMQIPPSLQQGVVGLPETRITDTSIDISSPKQPYRVNWRLLSAGGSSLENCRGHCCWRNPIGFACDLDRKGIFAVGSQYVASSARMGWLEGVSILPTENNNVVSLVLLLAFIADQYDLELTFDVANQTLAAFRVFGHSFDFPAKQCLSVAIMELLNDVRRQISDVFTTSTSTETPCNPPSKTDAAAKSRGMNVTIGPNDVSATLNKLLSAVLELKPSEKLPFFKKLSENAYLGPPSTIFSSSPSSAPPPPEFRPFQAFGRDFRPKGTVKIGFFRPGVVEIEEETPEEFFMLRPFDLTEMTATAKRKAAPLPRLTDCPKAWAASMTVLKKETSRTSTTSTSSTPTAKTALSSKKPMIAAKATASKMPNSDVFIETSSEEDEEEDQAVVDAARLVHIAPMDDTEVLDRVVTLLLDAPDHTLSLTSIVADVHLKKVVAVLRTSGGFKWSDFHRLNRESYSVCYRDNEACLKLKSAAAASEAKAKGAMMSKFVPSFVAMTLGTTTSTTTMTTAASTETNGFDFNRFMKNYSNQLDATTENRFSYSSSSGSASKTSSTDATSTPLISSSSSSKQSSATPPILPGVVPSTPKTTFTFKPKTKAGPQGVHEAFREDISNDVPNGTPSGSFEKSENGAATESTSAADNGQNTAGSSIPPVSQLLGQARQGKRGRANPFREIHEIASKICDEAKCAASSSIDQTEASNRGSSMPTQTDSSSSRESSKEIDEDRHPKQPISTDPSKASNPSDPPQSSPSTEKPLKGMNVAQNGVSLPDQKFLVERLSRHLIYRVGKSSSASSNASSTSSTTTNSAAKTSDSLYDALSSSSERKTSSTSQTLAAFALDPHISKLLTLLSWSQRDLKRFLEASNIFKKKKSEWVLTKFGVELFNKEQQRAEKELSLSQLLVRYLEGVRARVWVSDVAAHVDFPRAIFLKMLYVDPLIHLERQRIAGEEEGTAMSLASMEFDSAFWTSICELFASSGRAQLPLSDLVNNADLQRLVHRFTPCLLQYLKDDDTDRIEENNKIGTKDLATYILTRILTEERHVIFVPSMVQGHDLECCLNSYSSPSLHFPLFPPNSASTEDSRLTF